MQTQTVPTDTNGAILSTVTAAAPLLDLALPGLGTGISAASAVASNWYNSINNPKANPLGANSRALGYKKGGKISKAKAREILHDGKVHGHKLTPKQRRFMGAMANREMGGAIPLASDAVLMQGNPSVTDNISATVKGVPVKLDHNEVIIDNGDSAYVLSNSVMDPMTGRSIAESAMPVAKGKGLAEKKLSHNPYDQEALNTVMLSDHLLTKYQQQNEMQKPNSSTNSFAEGGNVDPDNIITVFKEYLRGTKGIDPDTLNDPELFKETSMKYVSEFIDSIVSEYSSPRMKSDTRIKMISDFTQRATDEYNALREGKTTNAWEEANQRASGRGMMLRTSADSAKVADINARIDSVSNAWLEQQRLAEARTKSEHDTFMQQLRAEEQQRQQAAFKSGQAAADWLMSPFTNRGHDQSYVNTKVGEPTSSGQYVRPSLEGAFQSAKVGEPTSSGSFNLPSIPSIPSNAGAYQAGKIGEPTSSGSYSIPQILDNEGAYTMGKIGEPTSFRSGRPAKTPPPPVPHYNEDQFRQIAGIGARPTYEANPFVEEDKLAQMFPDLFRQAAPTAPQATTPSTRARRAPRYVPGTQGFEVPVTGQTQQAYRDQQYTNERTAVPVEPLINEGKGLSVEGFQRYAKQRDSKALPKYGVDNKWGRETAGAWSKYGEDYIRSRYHQNNEVLPMLPASQYPQERQVTSGTPTVKPMTTKDGKLRFATGGGVDPWDYWASGALKHPLNSPNLSGQGPVSSPQVMPPVNQTGHYGPGVQIAPEGLGDATSTLAPWAYGPAKVPERYSSDFKGPYSIPMPQSSSIPTVTDADLARVSGTGGSKKSTTTPPANTSISTVSSLPSRGLPTSVSSMDPGARVRELGNQLTPSASASATGASMAGGSTMGDALQLLEVGSKFMGLAQGPQYEQLNLAPLYQVDAQPYLNQIQQGYATQRQGINTGSYNVDKGARQAAYAGQYQATGNVLDDVYRTNIALADQTSKFNLQQRAVTSDLNSRNQAAYDQATQNAFTTVGNTGRAYNQKEMGLQALDYLRTNYPDVFDYVVNSDTKRFKKGGKIRKGSKSC